VFWNVGDGKAFEWSETWNGGNKLSSAAEAVSPSPDLCSVESLKVMDHWSGALADMGCSCAALVHGKGGACVEWQIASSE
jgi:hypothetical protein